jgi:hypothetical protein
VARLLVGDRWYDGIASDALLEAEYERLVLQWGADLFPGWHVVPFKADVHAEFGVKRPDLALVDFEYRAWWVVEVELAHHSLRAHVLPQVEVLVSGRYDNDHASHLLAQQPALDENGLRDLIRGAPPEVLVVVNLPRPEWVAPLRQRGAMLSIVEVFRSDRLDHALRVNGEQPRPPADVVSVCHRIELIQRLMQLDSPGGLGGQNGDRFQIEFEGLETIWVRVDMADRVCLAPESGNPLAGWRSVSLIRLTDDRLAFDRPRRT